MKSTLLTVAILSTVCLFPGSHATAAQGVGASADLTGTVTDPTGAGVPNAKVTVMDPEKGVERSVRQASQRLRSRLRTFRVVGW